MTYTNWKFPTEGEKSDQAGWHPPMLPPPVEPPEPYSGYSKEYKQLGLDIYNQSKIMLDAQKKLTEAKTFLSNIDVQYGLYSGFLTESTGYTPVYTQDEWEADARRNIAEAQAIFDAAFRTYQSYNWRHELMTVAPMYLSDPTFTVLKAEDLINYVSPGFDLTDDDRAWLNQFFGKIEYLNNVLPENFQGDVLEAQDKILEELLQEPKLALKGVHRMAIEEIEKAFQSGVAPVLPPGMTTEQVRAVLSEMDLMEEELKEQRDWLAERSQAWVDEAARVNLIRAEMMSPEVPKLTGWQSLKLTFTQPMMATMELVDKYFSNVTRPLSAAVTVNLPAPAAGALHGALPGAVAGATIGSFIPVVGTGIGAIVGALAGMIGGATAFTFFDSGIKKDITEAFEYYKGQGESDWASYSKAFDDWDAPWYKKLLLESSFDPTLAIGFGWTTAAAEKTGSLLTKIGLRSLGSRIGPWVGAFENGYVSGMDAVFKFGKEVVLSPVKSFFWATGAGYTIPKTFPMMARNFARNSIMDLDSTLSRAHPEIISLKGATVDDVVKQVENNVRQAMSRPGEFNDLSVRSGASLAEFNYLDSSSVTKMLKGTVKPVIGPDGEVVFDAVKELTLDTPQLAKFNNNVLDMFSGQGERITAGKILADLSIDQTDETVSLLAKKLLNFKEQVAKDAVAVAEKAVTADKAMLNIFNHLEETRLANLRSPMTLHMQQAGRSTSWHGRVADRILYSSLLISMERRLVMPVARWNLLFVNFGPFNFLENSMRSSLGGGEFMMPRAYSGVSETNRLFKGLSNSPYDLVMFERGEERLAQAMIDPKTGVPAVFRGGRIPLVTKDVHIPEKIPFLGGKTLGFKMNIYGKDYYIGSFQDIYDMWASMNSRQVAYDYQVHYMKALNESAPDVMGELRNIVDKHRNELNSISAFSNAEKRDIERLLVQDATVGPEMIRSHADIDVLEFEKRVISKDIGKTMDKMTEVSATTKNSIRDDILDGTMFKGGSTGINTRMAEHLDINRDLTIVSLKPQIEALKKEVSGFMVSPPKDFKEFMGDLNMISCHVESVGERIHDYRRLTELRKARLNPADLDDFEVGSAKLLAEFMEESETEITKMLGELTRRARSAPINWEEVEWGAVFKANPELMNNAKKMIDSLPTNMKVDVKKIDIQPSPYTTPGVVINASYIPETKAIVFTDIDKVRASTFYHEMSHAHVGQKMAVGGSDSIEMGVQLSEFAKAAKADKIRYTYLGPAFDFATMSDIDIQAITRTQGFRDSYATFRPVHEAMATRFSEWMQSPQVFKRSYPNMAEFFEMHYPVREIGLTEAQLSRLTDLSDIYKLELENVLMTRGKIADVEAIIAKTPKRARNERFWQGQRVKKATIWDEYDTSARRFKDLRLRSTRNFLESVNQPAFVPDYVPEVLGDLTASHLAYLYGVSGDDLYRGLTRVQNSITIRPKEDFVLHTKELADAYAAKIGKTAENIGFTTEAIEDVYDQMWRSLGIEPSILTPDHPTVLQMEEIRQEIQRLYSLHKIPESDVVKWRSYIRGVADDVGNMPQYSKLAKVTGYVETPYDRKSVRDFWDERLERNDLRMHNETNAGAFLSYEIEAGGDIIREFGKEYIDTMYLTEKFNRIKRSLAYRRDWVDPLSPKELLYLDTIKTDIELMQAVDDATRAAKELLMKISRRDKAGIAKTLDALEPYISNPKLGATYRKGITTSPKESSAKWWNTKESAMTTAKEQHALSYPTYDDSNMIDEAMRAIFPFWNYEMFRWRWIPRTFLRTPGTMTGLARYMDYTDSGYVPVPGTDLQLNILRGSIWMGGLRSMYLRDFPEYHDVFPGIEFLDYIGRAGFFPGIHVMLPIAIFGSAEAKTQVGELTPSWIRTGLSGLRALSPEHIGKVLDIIYPDRFRDYLTMMTLGGMGYDADAIWNKKKNGEKLTEEEERLWLQAENKVDGLKGILMQQTGIFRIRPQEFSQMRSEMRLAIEDATGVPVSVQEEIDRLYPVTGKRFTDYYHLDIQQQALLYSWESYRRYQGIMTPLYPSSMQQLAVKIAKYYEDVEKIFDDARYYGAWEGDTQLRPSIIEINQQFIDGKISPSQWISQRGDIQSGAGEASRVLGNSAAYKDVPKTLDERAEYNAKLGLPPPTATPDQELMWYYFELQPEYKYNWDTGAMEYDFDSYYAHVDMLLESLAPGFRERFLQRIHSSWTPMEMLYWEYSREYARPYRQLRDVALRSYSPEEQDIIRRYEVARGSEREALLLETDASGNKIIAGFQSKLREARQRLRLLDPELDAWLNFFGTTDKLLSAKAEVFYADIRSRYLTQEMVGVVK